jgi:Tol biopolymer transport system component
VWSPDGHTIAFSRQRGQTVAICLIPPLGGAERKVVEGAFIGTISWSPDGRFLAVAENNPQSGSSSLYLVAVENGVKFPLSTPPNAKTMDLNPVFSPVGRVLVFARCGFYHCSLYLLDLAAEYRPIGEPRLLREERGDIQGAAWTEYGHEVVYAVSDDAGFNHHLMRMRAETGEQPQRLTVAGEHTTYPAIAPRGNRLAYTQELDDSDIWQVQRGRPARVFTSSTRVEVNPQYSPDGRHVAFQSDRSGLMQVWVCDGEGGNPVQLTHFDMGSSGTPRWSPDGHWIAFEHQLKEGYRIFVMASDGGQVRRLTEDADEELMPSWSADGKRIYYACNRTGRFEVWKAATQGGKGIQMTHHGGLVAFESRDGRSLYYTKDLADGLWALPMDGGEEGLVVVSNVGRTFALIEDGIYYIPAPAADGTTSLRFYSLATHKYDEIAMIREEFSGLAVSPNHKTILFSALTRSGSNVMLVENFR